MTDTEALHVEAQRWIKDKLPPEPWASAHIVTRLLAALEAAEAERDATHAVVAELNEWGRDFFGDVRWNDGDDTDGSSGRTPRSILDRLTGAHSRVMAPPA